MTLARGSMLALAVLACAWFAVGIRQARDINRATAIITGPSPSKSAAADAGSLLSSAAWLNPDSEVDLLRGRLALAQNDRSRSIQILGDVTRSEPMSLEAWVSLARAAVHVNPSLVKLSFGKIAQLDPRIR